MGKQNEKFSKYTENVLKPHQEMKLEKPEEHFYQMPADTWQPSTSRRLGEDEDLGPEN